VVVKDKIEVIDENTHRGAHMAQSAAQSEANDINNKNYKGTRFNLGTFPLGQKDKNIWFQVKVAQRGWVGGLA
jgi:hypothetical protein